MEEKLSGRSLPIKVPDQRIAISSPISTPSRAHLPIGQLQFVVFRRDLASDAPDRVAVRVVAQVKRALTFDPAGKPTVTKIEDTWVVRGNSYQMRVAPVADNPEMVVIRPEHAEFVFPAGRYALVLKNVAYDFTLDGPIPILRTAWSAPTLKTPQSIPSVETHRAANALKRPSLILYLTD